MQLTLPRGIPGPEVLDESDWTGLETKPGPGPASRRSRPTGLPSPMSQVGRPRINATKCSFLKERLSPPGLVVFLSLLCFLVKLMPLQLKKKRKKRHFNQVCMPAAPVPYQKNLYLKQTLLLIRNTLELTSFLEWYIHSEQRYKIHSPPSGATV